jgi:hypothetical protein
MLARWSQSPITAEAFAAIEATLLNGTKGEARPDGRDGYPITLRHGVLDKLKALPRAALRSPVGRKPP